MKKFRIIQYTLYSVQFGNQFPIQFEIGSQSTVLSGIEYLCEERKL